MVSRNSSGLAKSPTSPSRVRRWLCRESHDSRSHWTEAQRASVAKYWLAVWFETRDLQCIMHSGHLFFRQRLPKSLWCDFVLHELPSRLGLELSQQFTASRMLAPVRVQPTCR